MMILKDAMGLSDQQLFEACRFHLLYRQALGRVNLSDQIPTESTYYKFRGQIADYQRTHEVDLFRLVLSKITYEQIIRFNFSGKQVRMDRTLIGRNIASCSRFEGGMTPLMKLYSALPEPANTRMDYQVASPDG